MFSTAPKVGIRVSRMVRVAEAVVLLPELSVAVQVTMTGTPASQIASRLAMSLDRVIDWQLSVATALLSQLLTISSLPSRPHSIPMFSGTNVKTGLVSSATVTFTLQVAVLPAMSVALMVTTWFPVVSLVPAEGVWLSVMPLLQLSVTDSWLA